MAEMKINRSTLAAIVTTCCGLITMVRAVSAQTWTQTSAPITNWQAIACSADGSKIVAGFRGGMYTSTNFGANWVRASNAPAVLFPSVASSADGSKLVVVCNSNAPTGPSPGPILVSPDSGATWNQTSAPLAEWQAVASSADGKKLVAAARYVGPNLGIIYTSTNSGATWRPNHVPVKDWIAVACSADGDKVVAVIKYPGGVYYPTNSGVIYTSTNSGATWVSNSVPNMLWYAVASSADGCKLVAVSDNGISPSVYTSNNSGTSWVSNTVPAGSYAIVASSADGNKLMEAIPYGGHIYSSSDSGAHWAQTAAPATNWQAIASSADGGRLVAAVNGGGIYSTYSAPAPVLNISMSNRNLALSWIAPSTNFALQQSFDLGTAHWETITNAPTLDLTNLQNQVTIPSTNGRGFYRLGTS